MKFTATDLNGVLLIEPEIFSDHRGEFFRTYSQAEFGQMNLKQDFIQHNYSINYKKGTWRGLHFQYPPHTETKLVRCTRGAVQDFIVDIRSYSATFLQWRSFKLSAENKLTLVIPDGFAHGFITLEDHSDLIYMHSSAYVPGAEGGLHVDDPKLNLKLPIPIEVISERDKSYPFLNSDFKGISI